MLDQGAREVISLKQSDLAKTHFSKAELERILRIYKICKQIQSAPSLQKLYSGKLAWISETAKKHIKAFAEGKLTIDADAAAVMNDYVGEFGRTYKHEGNILKYVYTQEAKQARIFLAKMVYRQRIAAEREKAEVLPETNGSVARNPAVRKAPVSKTKKKEVIISRSSYNHVLKQVNKQGKKAWLDRLKNGLSNASQTMENHVGDTLKIATIAGLIAYPLINMGGKISDRAASSLGEHFSQSAGTANLSAVNERTDLPDIRDDFVVNDSDWMVELPDNFLWTEYAPEKSLSKDYLADNVNTTVDTQEKNDVSVAPVSGVRDQVRYSQEDEMCMVYSTEYAQVYADNASAYKMFALTLKEQFLHNISEMKSGRNLYREKEKLIGKYYSYNHIIPSRSCESMTFATFLDVLERDKDKQNYVYEACQDLLLQVVNPHGCFSNMNTFNGVSCKNLRKALSERLRNDEYGIYMVWIPRGGGKYHRQTVIGVGNGEAYLLAFNNNRAVKMKVDNLNKISGSRGYFANLGGKILNRANDLAIEDYKKEQMLKENDDPRNYLAQVVGYKTRQYHN